MEQGDTRIWTEMQGAAHTHRGVVLLANGGPGCCDYLQPLSGMLDDARCVIRFEQRGCGRSTPDGRYDLHTTLADMEAIRIAYGIGSWTVGGHSWGANLALVYALTHPERTNALLYIAGNGLQNDRAWSDAYHANRDARGETLPPMPYPGNAEVNRAGNASLRQFARQPDLYARLARLATPSLFVCAQEDIRPAWPAEQLCALMPNATLAIIPGAAHYLWLTHAQALADVLRSFMRTLSQPQAQGQRLQGKSNA